ncbi:hypothetical protein JL721_6558 [Aureococcus anophagefferens]|nr:hypothetical protein JL721_6558 [Aureococcus anophagefferens]
MASSLKKMLLLALATSQALRLPRLPVAKAPKAKRRALRAAAVASASLAQRAVASTVEAALPAAEVAAEATLVVARGPSPLLNAVRGLATAVFAFSIVNAVRRKLKRPRQALVELRDGAAVDGDARAAEARRRGARGRRGREGRRARASGAVGSGSAARRRSARCSTSSGRSPRGPWSSRLLTVPAEAALEGPAVAARRFSVAVAGLLISAIPDALVVSPGLQSQLVAPWVAARDARAVAAPAVDAGLERWKAYSASVGPASHSTGAGRGRAGPRGDSDPGAGLAGAWAAQCAATGCVSHYDFGVSGGAAARAGGAERAPWPSGVATLRAMVAGLDKAEAAATFANVVNAVLVALVDAAVPSLKRSGAEPPAAAEGSRWRRPRAASSSSAS